MESEKSLKYRNIKIILIFLVVLGHITRMYTPDSIFLGYQNSFFIYFTKFIYGFHMPLFMMISGAIFDICLNEKNKYHDTKLFVIKKFKRLIIPYLFIGICILPFVLKFVGAIDDSFFDYILYGILLGKNSRHLWYLSNLFFIFIIFSFLPKKNDNKFFIIYSILFFFIYFFKIYYISDLFYWAFFFYLGYKCNSYYDIIKTFLNLFHYYFSYVIFCYCILII